MKLTSFVLFFLGLGFHGAASSLEINGFDTSSSVLDAQQLVRIGPVNRPVEMLEPIKTVPISSSDWGKDDVVIGVEVNGEARAYPVAMMVWHEIVNDELGGEPILVTFCGLCGTGIVYRRSIDDKALTFGLAGLLYHSDILLYDIETKSLWSRYLDEAVTGQLKGKAIDGLPFRMMTIAEWEEAFPESTVVSRDNGSEMDYRSTPTGMTSAGDNVFASLPKDLRYHPDMPVLAIKRWKHSKVYPAGEILVAGGIVKDTFDGLPVQIQFLPEEQDFKVQVAEGIEVAHSHWSEWVGNQPDSEIFHAGKKGE